VSHPYQGGVPDQNEISAYVTAFRRIAANIEQVVLGKPEVVTLALTALFAGGHVLVEDVPGTGKTTLARALAASVRGVWRRVQFTPDLLPSDVTGVTIFNQANREFEFHPGPVFANVVIADEINRASPKTQSSLLEVMEERYVTVDGVRHAVPRPFIVVATQNPVEMDGTYRLPEAQLDRFLMRLSVGYPDEQVEIEVLRGGAARVSPEELSAVTDTDTVAQLAGIAQRVFLHDALYQYAVRLAAATRTHADVRLGLSPRGAIALTRAAQAYSLAEGRAYVLPEDFKALAHAVVAHRLVLTPDAQLRGRAATEVIDQILDQLPVPQPPAGGGTAPATPVTRSRAAAAAPVSATPSSGAGYPAGAPTSGAAGYPGGPYPPSGAHAAGPGTYGTTGTYGSAAPTSGTTGTYGSAAPTSGTGTYGSAAPASEGGTYPAGYPAGAPTSGAAPGGYGSGSEWPGNGSRPATHGYQ
jgi:MoxR-like ATPase